MKKLLAFLFLAAEASLASAAAVYTFTGPLYTSVGDYVSCGAGFSCGNYTTSMRITGSLTTSEPLQPNSTVPVFPADVVAFSFSDGQFTYTQSDPDVRLSGFTLTTDAQGHVTGGAGIIFKWLSGSAPHSAGDIYRYISFNSGGAPINAINNLQSITISPTDMPTGGYLIPPESSSGYKADGSGGTWTSVLPAPTLTSLTPASGAEAGGDAITLTGSNFLNGATVTIGGVPASSVTWTSATSLLVITPPGTLGARDVVVTNPDSQSVTLPGAYTYVALPAVASVPTLSQWSMIALAFLMTLFGLASRRFSR